MFNLQDGIDSLTNFKRQTAEYLKRLHKTGEPVVLTVNGKAEIVIQDAQAYQKLVEAAAKADREETVAAIRTGLADVETKRTKPARAALMTLARSTAYLPRIDSVKYYVHITLKAESDVAVVLERLIREASPAVAAKWFSQLMECIDTLETMPEAVLLRPRPSILVGRSAKSLSVSVVQLTGYCSRYVIGMFTSCEFGMVPAMWFRPKTFDVLGSIPGRTGDVLLDIDRIGRSNCFWRTT